MAGTAGYADGVGDGKGEDERGRSEERKKQRSRAGQFIDESETVGSGD